MNETVKHSPDLEGEFRVEEPSGFGCGNCGNLLFVGSSVCPDCGYRFAIPTPSLKRLNAIKHPAKMQGLALAHKGRLIASEIASLKATHPHPWNSR